MALRSNPEGQALVVAAIAITFYAMGAALLDYLKFAGKIYLQAGIGILLFGVTYFVVYNLFLKYDEKRIRKIFKATPDPGSTEKEIGRKHDEKESLSEERHENQDSSQTEEIKKLREMEKYRRDFLGNVSHELKTPIFNIQGYILTLLDGGIEDEKVNKLYLQRAEKSVNRMVSIVDDLVSISRLEAGEFKLELSEFNIIKLVEDIFESQEMLSRNYKIKLEFKGKHKDPVRVRADRKRILEVLNNLIMNSIKYGKSGGKTKVGFTENGKNVLVEVSDNGIGIDEEDIPRIFERFYRVDKSRSRDWGGTGLGLAIVKHIIQAHNQTINVHSRISKGTSFVFSLEKA
ncbi:MAG: sensor histidine kinase [Bacteroidales bacterium]|nr:sensor histidine kinase [Bacteroidales bacterium]